MEEMKRILVLIAQLFLINLRGKFRNPDFDFVNLPFYKYILIVVIIAIICLAKYMLDRIYY